MHQKPFGGRAGSLQRSPDPPEGEGKGKEGEGAGKKGGTWAQFQLWIWGYITVEFQR